MSSSRPFRPSRLLLLLASLALLSCSDDGIAGTGVPIAFTVTPGSLTLRPADTASIALSIGTGASRSPLRIDWSTGTPAIVTLDAVRANGTEVRVRAVAVGIGWVGLTLSAPDGSLVSATVPISVMP